MKKADTPAENRNAPRRGPERGEETLFSGDLLDGFEEPGGDLCLAPSSCRSVPGVKEPWLMEKSTISLRAFWTLPPGARHGKLFVKGKYRMALDVPQRPFQASARGRSIPLVKTDVVDGELLGGLGAQGFDAAHIHLGERLHLLRC